MLKPLFLAIVLGLAGSCSKSQSLEDFLNGETFQAKSEIDPLFEAKTLAEIHGNGEVMEFTVKVPLSKETISYYDASDVLEDQSLDEEKLGFFKRIWNSMKYGAGRLAVRLGAKSRVKLFFNYELPEVDSKYFKSVKVKRIFFAIEDCPADDPDCSRRNEKKSISLDFLNKFFLNISPLPPGKEIFLTTEELGKKEFNRAANRAYFQDLKAFDPIISERDEMPLEAFNDFNVAYFHNSEEYRKSVQEAGALKNVLLLRLSRSLSKDQKLELIQDFKSDKYKNILKDFSLIGHNMYFELVNQEAERKFFNILELTYGSVDKLGNDNFVRCDETKCADLQVKGVNLVPMLERSPNLLFETYISINQLEMNDFRYNGFVELEVQVDLGI